MNSSRRRVSSAPAKSALSPLVGLSILLAVPAVTAPASAQAPGASSAVAPAGAGQQALAVRASAQGITARVCSGGGECSAEGGAALDVGPDVKPLLGRARVSAVALA